MPLETRANPVRKYKQNSYIMFLNHYEAKANLQAKEIIPLPLFLLVTHSVSNDQKKEEKKYYK